MLGLLWFCSACSTENSAKEVQSSVYNSGSIESIDGYFVEVGRQGSYSFLYDTNTKVMYTQYFAPSSGFTSLTVMLKADGKPLTYEEWKSYKK